MSDAVKDYARAVAEAVGRACMAHWRIAPDGYEPVDLDAIIASVPRPTPQHHDAPTCDGWWWVSVHGGEWQMKCVVGKTVWQNAQGESWRMSYSGWNARWVGPLLPPDTTEPAPVATPTCDWPGCSLPPLNQTTTRCGRHWNMASRREQVATPTPDIDPEKVRRALRYHDEYGYQDITAIRDAAREWLRIREQPAPDEELPRRGGGTIGVGTLAYFQANNENQLQQAMLRRVIALEKALGRERARALLCERLGVEAESLGDLLCARSDLDAISDVMLAAGAMFDVGVEVLPDLSQQLPIHGPVRLPSMPIVPQPAPDVQAVKLCNCGKCCPGPLYSQHERDAAVARERKVIEARLRKTAECYPQSSDGRNTFLLEADWVRARSAKGA